MKGFLNATRCLLASLPTSSGAGTLHGAGIRTFCRALQTLESGPPSIVRDSSELVESYCAAVAREAFAQSERR